MRHLLLVCLLVLCHSANALDRFQVQRYSLPNGLQILLKPGDDKGHVAIRLVVGVGFDDFSCERKETPHLLEHAFFSGLDGHDEAELEQRMQTLGGEWNAFTSDSDTAFVIEAPAVNQRKALDLLLSVITQPPLDDNAIRSSKQAVTHEDGGHDTHLEHLLDHDASSDDDATAQLAVEMGLKCPGQASVDSLTAKDLEKVRHDWYAPNNMTLIMVGDIDRQLPAYIEHGWGKLQPITPNDHPPLPEISQKAAPQRNLITHWLGEDARLHWFFTEPELGDQDAEIWELLNNYLDWQLYIALRLNSGLSYGPWAEQQAYGSQGFISLNADIDRDDLDKAQQVMSDLLDNLRKNGLDANEFRRLQNVAVAKQAWAVEGDSAVADFYWQAAEDSEDGHLSNAAKQLQAVTLTQANEALRQLLAEPGYIRIEKTLLDDSDLYWLGAAAAGLLALVIFCVYRQRQQRRRLAAKMQLD